MRIRPSSAEWMQLSHLSAEPGHALLQAALARETGSPPLLDLGMRLGEGSGAALAIPLVRLALDLHREMATFAEAGVSGADRP
ncbi:MAG: nicotinate-nucleotide--dimethylbenzimidazole phosphoribosyltransferase, partial [Gammaproteobacteria bacterium]|nr:nicotinate-nucleotide--dimethylbenzimidazole phosphoribosyltransferase [Gammaproteobacteria bacterium]